MVWTRSQIWRFHVQECGRLRKTWSDCVKADMNVFSLGGIDPQKGAAWRSGIRSTSRLLPTPATGFLDADENKM